MGLGFGSIILLRDEEVTLPFGFGLGFGAESSTHNVGARGSGSMWGLKLGIRAQGLGFRVERKGLPRSSLSPNP